MSAPPFDDLHDDEGQEEATGPLRTAWAVVLTILLCWTVWVLWLRVFDRAGHPSSLGAYLLLKGMLP